MTPLPPVAGRHAGQSHAQAASRLPRRAWSIQPAAVAAVRASSMRVAVGSCCTTLQRSHATAHAPFAWCSTGRS